jgi:hypothetical protein
LTGKTTEQFLYLSTRGWRTGKRHKIEIWFVEDSGLFYVMSEGMARSHWVQNILHDPLVTFSVHGRRYEGKARVIDTKTGRGKEVTVKALMKQKYGWDAGLIIELTKEP